MGRKGDGVVLAGGPHQFPGVHAHIGQVDLFSQGRGNAVHQKMAVAGIQFRPFEDQDFVLGRQLGIIQGEVKLAVFGQDNAVHDAAPFPQNLNPFDILRHGSAGVVGGNGVAVQVEVHRTGNHPFGNSGRPGKGAGNFMGI